MTAKTYSKRSNATRAARRYIGGTEGHDWKIVQQGDGKFRVEPVVHAPEPANEPQDGAVYALTGGSDDNCVSNGDDWEQSRVDDAAFAPEAEGVSDTAAADLPPMRLTGRYRREWDAARNGTLPTPPDFSAATHKRFRGHRAALVEMAENGDLAGLRSYKLNPVSSSPKALERYRVTAIRAIEAQQESATDRPGDQAARYAASTCTDHSTALARCNMD